MIDLNRKLRSRVSEIFKDGMTPFERHVVDEMDVMRQQNEMCIQGLNEVREQALKTNGRVNTLEDRAEKTEAVVGGIKKLKRWVVWGGGVLGGFLLYLADKLITRWVSCWIAIATFALAGCGGSRAVAVQHRKPDVSPVSQPVAETRLAIAATRGAVSAATVTAGAGAKASVVASGRAAELAKSAALAAQNGLAAKSVEAERLALESAQLATEVEGLKVSLFRVTMELREAEAAVSAAEIQNATAEKRLVEFDALVAQQTATLNERELEVANERQAKELALAARREAVGALAGLRWKIGLWLTVAGLVITAAFYFRLIKFGP